MKVALAVTVTVAVVAALVSWTEGQFSLSCGRWRDMCGWTSVKNETNTLKWTVVRKMDHFNDGYNYYARLYVGGHDAGDKGVMESPWLQPWPPGYRCQLQFQYYIEKDYGCRLSLLQEKANITSLLWDSTTSYFFPDTFTYDLDCTGGRYKLYFKGERISDQPYACGRAYNEIYVDNIVYRIEPGEPPPTSHPLTATTSTLTTIVNSTQQVSCRFWPIDKCKWKNEQSTNNTLTWRTTYRTHSWPLDFFARLNVGGHHAGDQGVLESPLLQPQLLGYRCRLQFQYYLEKNDGCRLSLLQRKGDTCSRLWNTTTASFLNETFSSDLNCTGDLYKLYFKGERISNQPYACGDNGNNAIYVDNIVYHVLPGKPPPTSHPTTTATGTTLTIFSMSMSTQVQGDSTASDALVSNNTEGIGSASIAGITIAAILVVVVITVVVIIISRRRNNDGDKTKTWLAHYFRKAKRTSASQNNTRRAVSNSGYVPDDQFITSVRMPDSQMQSDEDTDHVYNAPEEPYVNLATTVNSASARLPKHTHQNPRHPGNNHSQDANELATAGDQTKEAAKNGKNNKQDSVYEFAEPHANEIKADGGHDYYNHTNLKGAKNKASAPSTDDTYDHTQSDRLNLQNSKATSDDTYNHTGPQDNIVKNQAGSTSYPGFDDTYDHTQARRLNQKDQDDTYDHTHDDQFPKATPNSDDTSPRRVESPNDEDEYSVPQTKTVSIPTTGKAAAIADGSRTMLVSKEAAKGKRTAAKGKPGYENITEDHPKTSANPKQARLQDNTEYSLAKSTTPAQSSQEATESEASVYEVVDHDEDHGKTAASVPADDVYNELDVRGESAAEKKVQQRHYDHVHDPDEYSELHGEDWTRDQQREADADQYSHIHNC